MSEYVYPGSVADQELTLRQVMEDGLGPRFRNEGVYVPDPVPREPGREMEFLTEALGRSVPTTAHQRHGERIFYLKRGWILVYSVVLDCQVIITNSHRNSPIVIPRSLDDRPIWPSAELRSIYDVALADPPKGYDMLRAAHRLKTVLGAEVWR